MAMSDAALRAELRQARAERDVSEGDVGRLRLRIAELLDERTSTNSALAEMTVAFRAVEAERDALRSRVGELEAASRRYRTAWRMARTRALSTGSAADRYAARARELQTALQDATAAILAGQAQKSAVWAGARVLAPMEDRYVIGCNGVFATLWDRQEQRLVVENSTEEHCRTVRDDLISYREGQLAEFRHQLLDPSEPPEAVDG
jgi:chromosome segregation ATPase